MAKKTTELAEEKPARYSISFESAMNKATKIHEIWLAWNMADGPYALHNGVQMKAISSDLDRAIMHMTDEVADGPDEMGGQPLSVEPRARRVVLLLDAIAKAYLQFRRDVSRGLPSAVPSGSSDLVNALRALHDFKQERKLPPPESMQRLVELGAPYETIAKKYGWKTPDGYADTVKAMDAARDPKAFDAAFNPDEWVNPAQLAIQAEVDAKWSTREPRPRMFRNETAETPRPPVPPTIEEMILAKAPAQQISNVHKVSVEDIESLAKDMGIDLSERYIKPANETVAIQEAIAKQQAGSV